MGDAAMSKPNKEGWWVSRCQIKGLYPNDLHLEHVTASFSRGERIFIYWSGFSFPTAMMAEWLPGDDWLGPFDKKEDALIKGDFSLFPRNLGPVKPETEPIPLPPHTETHEHTNSLCPPLFPHPPPEPCARRRSSTQQQPNKPNSATNPQRKNPAQHLSPTAPA